MKNKMCILMDADQAGELLTLEVRARLRKFGKDFWIAKFCPWIHPYNRVPNCMALTLDGFIHYKFSLKYDEKKCVVYKVAKVAKDFFVMDVKIGEKLTHGELLKKIETATVGGRS